MSKLRIKRLILPSLPDDLSHDTPISIEAVFFDCNRDTKYAFLDEGLIIPTELRNANDRRVVEFLAGRIAAKNALRSIGEKRNFHVGLDKKARPQWPRGYVGSISHTDGLAIASAQKISKSENLGIDAQRVFTPETLERVREFILTEEEVKLGNISGLPQKLWATMVFSAKESLYKCLNPITEIYLDQLDVAAHKIEIRKSHFVVTLKFTNKNHQVMENVSAEYLLEYNTVITWLIKNNSSFL